MLGEGTYRTGGRLRRGCDSTRPPQAADRSAQANLVFIRSENFARSITIRSCVPIPISSFPSRARIVNSIRRPSTFVTSASPVTRLPTGVAARWRTSTRVPSALSPAPRYGLMALSAAFSMTMIMTGVASTAGNVASLKRLARWSGMTTRLNEPWVPSGIGCTGFPSQVTVFDTHSDLPGMFQAGLGKGYRAILELGFQSIAGLEDPRDDA